jgi:drug/metabolite transporter (DMT)-like permease
MGFLFGGETLTGRHLLGMALTTGGIILLTFA